MSLDGELDYVDCGNPTELNFSTGNWSLSAWVKNTMTGTGDLNKGAIIANGGDGGGGHRYCLIQSEQQEAEVTLVTDDNADKYQARGDTTKVNDDVWHHVLGVRDGDVIRIYIDGVEEGSASLKAGYDLSGTSQANVLIGAMTLASDGSKYKDYAGLIDDAQIYDCALTEGNARYMAGLDDKVVPPVVVPNLYGPLLAHYEFEGNANDSTDNHYDGMLMGDANIVDGALVLDGDGDAVTIPGFKGVTGTNAFTISAWLKKTATEDSSIVCWGSGAGRTRVDFRLDNIRLRVEHGAGNIVGKTTNVVTDGEWHHVALTVKENATMSSTDLTLWLDGVDDTPVKTDPDAFDIIADKDVGIGYRPTSNSRWYNGSIDDVRIYNYELSAGEIRYIGGHGDLVKPGYFGPCIVHWAMDEGSGDTVADSSGNGLDGAITGAAWTATTADGSAACLDFEGGANAVNEDAGPYLNDLAGLSISMWIQSDVINTDKGFIIGRNPEGNDQRGIRYDTVGASGGGDDVIKYGVACTDGADESESSVGIQTTAWQHIVMVWDNDGTGTDLYINGVPDAKSFDGDNRTGLTSGYTKLLAGKGAKDGAADAGWDGRIDDVRVYDYRLSEGEVRYLAGVGDLVLPTTYIPMVLEYNFDTDTTDTSGNGNDGTLFGDAKVEDGVLKLDGAGDYLDVGDTQLTNITGQVTLSAWINLNVADGDMKVAGNQDGSTGGYKLGYYDGRMEFEIRTSGGSAILNRWEAGGTVLSPGVWYHVAGVYSEGNYIRTYVNGRLDRELLTTEVLGGSAGTLKLGREPFSDGSYFNGMVDRVRVYNTALSYEQISGLAGCENPIGNTWFSNGVVLPQLDYEVAHGGDQSMKVEFGGPWQVMRIPPFEDFTAGKAKALTMYFKGDAGNTPGQLFAQINPGCTVEYDGSPEDLMNPDWTEWNIALADFPCDPTATLLSVGVSGGSGVLRFDDMRLYPSRCVPALSWITDLNKDCSVDGKDLRILIGDYLMGDYTVYAEEPDAAGLLAHYEFNDNYDDSSGNGNHGTPVGEGITIEDDPTMGKVLSLPGGSNVFVDCNDVGISGTMPRTIACWAKADHTSIPDWTLVFGFTGTATGGGGCGSHFNIGSIGGPQGVGAHAWCWEETIFTDTEALDWRHYVMTYNGERILYYGDGEPKDTDPGKSNYIDLSIQADRLHIGSRVTQDSSFPGKVDDARVYNYELSWGEIKTLAGKLDPVYIPLDSIANIYDEEPVNSKKVNLKDYALIGNDWLNQIVWP